MGRPKTYDKRFHFNGPSELDRRAHAIAAQRTAAGVTTTASDILREALATGLDALETCAPYAHETCTGLDADLISEAGDVLHDLVELGDAVARLDPEAIRALADLDVGVLRALRYLDADVLDALATLDAGALSTLEGTADELTKLLDSAASA